MIIAGVNQHTSTLPKSSPPGTGLEDPVPYGLVRALIWRTPREVAGVRLGPRLPPSGEGLRRKGKAGFGGCDPLAQNADKNPSASATWQSSRVLILKSCLSVSCSVAPLSLLGGFGTYQNYQHEAHLSWVAGLGCHSTARGWCGGLDLYALWRRAAEAKKRSVGKVSTGILKLTS